MATKYSPLYDHLVGLPRHVQQDTLSLRKIEHIIGATLPSSAFGYNEWWANQRDNRNRPQARAWMMAGRG